MEIYIEKETNKVKFYDEMMHSMGVYILTAFNDPKNYPKSPFHSQTAVKAEQTDDDMERIARRNTLLMGGEIK